MKFIGIIPARYASTRFPGKPLALLGGKPMIQRVYEQVTTILNDVIVATDDSLILNTVNKFGGKAVITSPNHKSGTDRCFEALTKLKEDYDVVINIQGDEPFIQKSQIETICQCFNDPNTEIATLARYFHPDEGFEALYNPNSPKVIIDKNNYAMYFSRSIIPYIRGYEKNKWLNKHAFLKHIGLYAYRVNILKEITQTPMSTLEKAESLEQLRWLQNGYRIKVGLTNVETIGIDTPQDMENAEIFLKKLNSK
jgi:3-deoxy-manno-octulosonate cytidylyltransferase (CMP-KDO synthetase)